jgi:DNA-binding HxlR family transcriptional regulator
LSATHTADTAEEHDHVRCRALGAVLDRIADKWTIMAVGALAGGPMRFNAMVRLIGGVSQRMLTLTLRNLEKDGLVTRTVYPTIPPRVDYELTPLGRTLIEPLGVLSGWAQAHLHEMEEARRAYEERKGLEAVS